MNRQGGDLATVYHIFSPQGNKAPGRYLLAHVGSRAPTCLMSHTVIGLYTFEIHLPEAGSLKEKRSRLKSMISRIHNTFNVSTAEIGSQDVWQSALIAVAIVTNSSQHAHQVIGSISHWIEKHYPDLIIVRDEIEII